MTAPSPNAPLRPERPRDELGRPLPAGSATRLQLEPFDRLDPDTNQRLAVQHFNRGQFFAAHEAWEACWRAARETADEAFFKSLAQLAAGYTHWRRGNAHGARALLERASAGLRAYPPRHRGLDVAALLAAAREHAARFGEAERAGAPPPAVAVAPLALDEPQGPG
ncbi:MAG: DUF309 domain-containing protein [Dehalococcoidia bacterium]|nr:DUF309 domain-containing protein [Dehalococcoidia bacterium]